MIYRNIFQRIFHASIYSLNGLYFALHNEQAFRYEALIFLIICIALFIFPGNFAWNIALIIAWLPVMCFELVNSAVEKAFDLIDSKYNNQIKAGKDMLSAAVFLTIFANIILWLFVFYEKFFN